MPRTRIPDGITTADVNAAIQLFSSGAVEHGFHDSTTYDLLHDGRRYPPKAIVGIAARRIAGRIMRPSSLWVERASIEHR